MNATVKKRVMIADVSENSRERTADEVGALGGSEEAADCAEEVCVLEMLELEDEGLGASSER